MNGEGSMKNKLYESIDRHAQTLTQIADDIFDRPELLFKETYAMTTLCDTLQSMGFQVERGLGSLDTAFRATWVQGQGGPIIGLLAEYDALPMGHACGHHMQGPAIIGAAAAIKENCAEQPYTLVVYGTPAEEGGAGKQIMLKDGYIHELDVALMMHGGPATQVDVKSMAMKAIEVTFTGKSAHAALKPEMGRSALDALLLTFHACEFLREHVQEDTRIHYTVLDAGGPANVVPAHAKGSFYLRSYNSSYLQTVWERFKKIVEGASLMTETEYKIVNEPSMNRESKVPVHLLNDLIMSNARSLNAPNIKGAREKTGSTDFGDVTYVLPGSCLRIAFVPEGTSSHSQEFLNAGKTDEAHRAIILSAKTLAATAWDLISDPEKVRAIQTEFKDTLNRMSAV